MALYKGKGKMGLNSVSDLTKGNILKTLCMFAVPMILGNLLQQVYNITDTIIVGRFVGAEALAAVGAAYTLMTFLTSVIIGLCMGSGALFSATYGASDEDERKEIMWAAFWLIELVTVLIYVIVFGWTDEILHLLQVPDDVFELMRSYVRIIFVGLGFTFLYNYFSFAMRAVGNSVTPLVFLVISTVINIGLDLLFVIVFHMGVAGTAWATIIAQATAGIGITLFGWLCMPALRMKAEHRFAGLFMGTFVDGSEAAIVEAGVRYLRIEGAFYWGIGCLFLLYGLYRAIGKPEMSLVLTVVSLGTRVALAYLLAPNTSLGVLAIWWAIPIGWILADIVGFCYYRAYKNHV